MYICCFTIYFFPYTTAFYTVWTLTKDKKTNAQQLTGLIDDGVVVSFPQKLIILV